MSTDVKVNLESSFGIAICKLLAKYPLYDYWEDKGNGEHSLSVLLIGQIGNLLERDKDGNPYANHLKKVLKEVLANGQLLKTSLHVTVLSDTAQKDGRDFCNDAPDLYRFIEIKGVHEEKPDEFKTEWPLGCLEFKQESPEMHAAGSAAQHRFVFISTGDDARDEKLASSIDLRADGVLAYTRKDDIQVRTMEGGILREETLREEGTKDPFMQRTEDIARNLKFVYEKSQDVRETRQAINETFGSKKYDRLSDLETALHVRSKLFCCGIDTKDNDLKEAASDFAKKLKDPQWVERLAELEHRRWCISKMLQGYRCPDGVEDIFQNGDETHSRNPNKKWHTILVPYEKLDQRTEAIRKRCEALGKENEDKVNRALDELQILAMKNADELRDVLPSFTALRSAVKRLWMRKRSVVPTYKRHLRVLEKKAKDLKAQNKPELAKKLNKLNNMVEAQIEWVTEKNYKRINEILVEQIPFALTHKVECVLVKPMADSSLACLFSPWRLEPTTVHYVDFVESQEELRVLANRADRLNSFLEHNNNKIERRYHFLHSAGVVLDITGLEKQFGKNAAELHRIPSSEKFADTVNDMLNQAHPDYIDLTGGNPMLTCAARQYAEDHGVGAFYVRGGMLRNICNAAELEYEGPEMDITVQEMFDKAGASLIKTDSQKMSDSSCFYQTFWDIARKERDSWDGFCKQIEAAYGDDLQKEFVHTTHRHGKVLLDSVTLDETLAAQLIPILMQLCEHGYLNKCDVRENNGQYTLEYGIRNQQEKDLFKKTLQELEQLHRQGFAFDVEFTDVRKYPHIICRSLQVSEVMLPSNKRNLYKNDFLAQMEQNGLITDLKYKYNGARCSFKAASADVLSILLNSGKVLENYIYYSAMLDGGFDDVDMSVFFKHTAQGPTASNEVDVICTRGISSLFISAKNMTETSLSTGYINDVCYEVSVLADQFGINARRVFVAPAITHLKGSQRTKKVQHALNRNVYLIGNEFCQGDKLGKVLQKIAAGDKDWDKI